MSVSVTMFHNPRCSKSRQTLALLEEHGISPQLVEYLKTPPSAEEILALAEMLQRPLDDCLRHKEEEYRTHVAGRELDDAALAALVHQYPKMLERPIVVRDQRAAIGRPPEQVLTLLD